MRMPGKYGLVLAEGKTDIAVLERIAQAAGIGGLRFENFGGSGNLKSFLEVLVKRPDFVSGRIGKVLITRDADDSFESAWSSVRGMVAKVFGPSIEEPGRWESSRNGPRIAAWIVPGSGRTGMIESLCLDVAKKSAPDAFECLLPFTSCLRDNHGIELHEKERFDIWTIIAQGPALGRKRMSFSDALARIGFDWADDTFSELRDLLESASLK